MSAKHRLRSHGRINPPEKQRFVGGGKGSSQRSGTAVAQRCRTECVSRIETTSMGTQCAVGTGTHSVERGMAGTPGLRGHRQPGEHNVRDFGATAIWSLKRNDVVTHGD